MFQLPCRVAMVALAAFAAQGAPPPKTWIDPDTGHRIVRLTDEPNSASLYFNQNGYTADGKQMVYTTPEGVSVLNLETHAAKQVVKGRVQVIVTGHKTQNVYYKKGDEIFATDVDTLQTRRIAQLPPRGSVATVNADETLLGGTYIEGNGQDFAGRNPPPGQPPAQPPAQPAAAGGQGAQAVQAGQAAPAGQAAQGGQAAQAGQGGQIHPLDQARNKGQMMEQRLAAHLPMAMFTVNTKTGELKVIQRATDWLNHLEFSPTDPNLLMFCHEGPWHKVDRIWTIRMDTGQITQIHHRTMAGEIFGHEFWGHDGATIWYDLQTPRGEDFWLAGYNVETQERTRYHLQRDEWSIHFNVTRDGKLFCGDGGNAGQVAKAKDGQWIYLFHPEKIAFQGEVNEKGFVQPGVLHAEKLVNMAKHNYRLEPNVSFTPDQKWVVFRSNMFGDTYAFAVEVEKAK